MIGDIAAGQGTVVLTNSDDGAPLMAEIVEAIAHEYKWPAYPRQLPSPIGVPASAFQRFAGDYTLRPGFTVTIFLRDTAVWLQATHQQPIRLLATSETSFISDVIGMELSFMPDERDGSIILELRQSNGVQRARKG